MKSGGTNKNFVYTVEVPQCRPHSNTPRRAPILTGILPGLTLYYLSINPVAVLIH
jgi:hypothetical protein